MITMMMMIIVNPERSLADAGNHLFQSVRVRVRVRVRVKFLFLFKVISSGLIFWLREFVSDQINS